MAQSTSYSIVIVTALLTSALSHLSTENVYCVTPTASSCHSCPHNSANCTTLSEYAQEAELYFTPKTTMVFLPGDHALDANITVANITKLMMRGNSSSGNMSTIACNGLVGLSFTGMVAFEIYSLAFTSCSRNYTLPDIPFGIVHVALLLQSSQSVGLVNCSFHDNPSIALVVTNTNVTLAETNFTHNQWCLGSIIAFSSNLIFTGNTTFLENRAQLDYCGGSGGAIFALSNTVLNFTGTSNIINNSASVSGGAIYVENTVLSFNGISNFINNSAAARGGAIFALQDNVLSFNKTTNFISNSAEYGGGAIYVNAKSELTFNEIINFTNNVCRSRADVTVGGGVYMGLKCNFSILPHTTVYWKNNHATLGGAIYVADASPKSECASVATLVPKEECFFQLPGQNLSNSLNVQLVFQNNTADDAGSVLYGGAIDNCKLTGLESYSSGEVFDMIFHNKDTYFNTSSKISNVSNTSSAGLRICSCENNLPDCSKYQYQIPYTVYPGEVFQVSVVTVGQRDGTVPSPVIGSIDHIFNPGDTLDSRYIRKKANNTCTTLSYAVSSLSSQVVMNLRAESAPCGDELGIFVYLNQICPHGFNISEKSCVCEPRLAHYAHSCNITSGIIREADEQFWVGFDNQFNELILHPLCPFDYCVSYTVVVPLNNTDVECAYNRSGLLCGACKKGYSLVLSTSQCKRCTNSYLVLLVPFALMGIALVFLLLVCKLTVATGTLSALVFYANIVGTNNIFLPVEFANPSSVFISWVNLDLGIETCFYNGLDSYSKTWLQFAFPVYIWMLVGLIILISHFSRRFARLMGSNPVSVLATLILLSYAKMLRTLIAAIHITYLEYPTYNRSVWLYDANIDYLCGRHIPLFLVAVLIFLFLFLPYTFLLLFGQWLQAISHLRLFSWVNKLKPFLDAYHAPYKAKHRYWPGLLLVFRFVLLLVFALNPQHDPSINLLTILVGNGILVVWACVSGGVYKSWYLDALEGSFALNLIILVGATYHVNHSGGNQLVVGFTSVSIALATFFGILVFQLASVTGFTRYLKTIKCIALNVAIQNIHQADAEEQCLSGSLPDRLVNPWEYKSLLHSSQEQATGKQTIEKLGDKAQGKQNPVHTYDSINS